MEIIKTLIWVVEIFSALAIVVLVLLQHGKGADAGATFGSGGGSGSLFGASGSANFLSRTTAIFAAIFFVSTFALVLLLSHGRVGDAGVMSGLNKNASSASSIKAVNNKMVASGVGGRAASATVKPAANHENQIPQ